MSKFRLHSSDSDFNNRVDTLFNSLESVATDLKPVDTSDIKQSLKREAPADFDDECDGFIKPCGRPPVTKSKYKGARHDTPDYVKNPQKWTRYNMKDTRCLSDSETKKTGLELLRELRARRLGNDEKTITEDDEDTKILFKKPSQNEDCDSDKQISDTGNSCSGLFGGSKKICMPEYEIGKKKTVSKITTTTKKPIDSKERKELKLNHLSYSDEEDENEG